jgi:hypothetical protein
MSVWAFVSETNNRAQDEAAAFLPAALACAQDSENLAKQLGPGDRGLPFPK